MSRGGYAYANRPPKAASPAAKLLATVREAPGPMRLAALTALHDEFGCKPDSVVSMLSALVRGGHLYRIAPGVFASHPDARIGPSSWPKFTPGHRDPDATDDAPRLTLLSFHWPPVGTVAAADDDEPLQEAA